MYIIGKGKGYKLNILLCVYGIVIFLFLHYYQDFPRSLRKYRQPLYTLIEYSSFALIFYFTLSERFLKKVILFTSIGFYIFQIIYFIYSKPQKLDSVPIGIETIILFSFAVIFFQQCLKINLQKNIYDYPSFWLVVGLLIYLAFGFFFNILVNHLSQQELDKFWHYTYIPDIVKNILFAFFIINYSRQKRVSNKDLKKNIPNLDMI